MFRTSCSAIAIGFLALLTSPGARAEAVNEPLDLGRYVELVMQAHPAARLSTGLEEAGRAERKAARLFPDPVVAYTRDRARPAGASSPAGTERGYSISQSLIWPGTYAAGAQAGERAAEGFHASAEAVKWEIEIEAREAFFRLLSARALLEIAREAEGDARSLRDLVDRRVDLGESREADRIKTTVEWLRQERTLRGAERAAAAAEAVARTLAVSPLPRPLLLRGDLPGSPPRPHPEAIRTRLLERNPRLRAARLESERQAALLSQVRRSRLPDLDFTYFHDEELDKEAEGFGVSLRLPLWNAGRGAIARSAAASSVASAEAEGLRLELLAELEARLRDLEVASSQAAILESDLLPAASKSLDLARFSYQEGETSLLDLLDAQRTHRETQRESAEARLDLALALSELQRLLGPDFHPAEASQ